jgi:hypothetical protein
MGAARATGAAGSTIAGVSSGEPSSGVGAPNPALTESEKDGANNEGVGLGEEVSTQRLDSCSEDAGVLGYDSSTSTKSSKLSASSTPMLSTIPESDEVLGNAILSPEKSSSEFAGEVGIHSPTSDKQPKLLKVFQRRESPSSKTTKSWVAERVSWNSGMGCDETTEVHRV